MRYDKTLKRASTREKRAWTARVLAAIEQVGLAPGDVFEIHAGADYRSFGLVEGLRARGALVDIPAEGLTVGRQLQFYAREH